MGRRRMASALCALVLAAGPLTAGSPPPGQEKSRDTATVDANSRIITGMVTDYRPGKWLAVRTEKNGIETFKLDEDYPKVDIDARVAVGSKVTVTERVEGGARSLMVAPI